MKNKKGQIGDWEEIIKLILVAPILIALIGAIFTIVNQPNCPSCEDCTPYKNKIQNLSDCLNKTTEIVYINQTVEVPVTEIIEKPIYRDSGISITFITFSFILSLFLTFNLFRIEIKLPNEIGEKLKHYDKWLIRIKWVSLTLSILILIKLIMIIWSLF